MRSGPTADPETSTPLEPGATVVPASDGVRVGSGAYWSVVGSHWIADPPQRLWRRFSDRVTTELLDAWLPAGMERVLKTDLFDEAVSEGLHPLLASRAREVVGIDVAPSVIGAACARYPSLGRSLADVRRLPFATASFDAAVSTSTLDHFDSEADIASSLAELARVVRTGGTLVLTLDNPSNPLVALRNALPQTGLRRVGLVPYQVGVTCGARRAAELLRGAGFEVIESRGFVHCPRALAVALARVAGRRSAAVQARFVGALRAFERLDALPTRFLTGHYVALRARRLPTA